MADLATVVKTTRAERAEDAKDSKSSKSDRIFDRKANKVHTAVDHVFNASKNGCEALIPTLQQKDPKHTPWWQDLVVDLIFSAIGFGLGGVIKGVFHEALGAVGKEFAKEVKEAGIEFLSEAVGEGLKAKITHNVGAKEPTLDPFVQFQLSEMNAIDAARACAKNAVDDIIIARIASEWDNDEDQAATLHLLDVLAASWEAKVAEAHTAQMHASLGTWCRYMSMAELNGEGSERDTPYMAKMATLGRLDTSDGFDRDGGAAKKDSGYLKTKKPANGVLELEASIYEGGKVHVGNMRIAGLDNQLVRDMIAEAPSLDALDLPIAVVATVSWRKHGGLLSMARDKQGGDVWMDGDREGKMVLANQAVPNYFNDEHELFGMYIAEDDATAIAGAKQRDKSPSDDAAYRDRQENGEAVEAAALSGARLVLEQIGKQSPEERVLNSKIMGGPGVHKR